MHPSTALATVVVDELIRGGVREAVLAPGSRSAPFAYALAEADRAGRLRLHVRVDERSAGFLALGLARGSGRPVPVVTTSGTAVANLHPAVLEAHHGGVALVVLSADRPAELRGTGANQTTVQPGIFSSAVRWEKDLPAPGSVDAAVAAQLRTTVCRALVAARGPADLHGAGPVHLNVGLRDPLVPLRPGEGGPGDRALPEELSGRPEGAPWTWVDPGDGIGAPPLEQVDRTLMLLGDLPDPALTRQALRCADAAGWPVLAEPFGVLPTGGTVVPHGVLVAADPPAELVPDRILVAGRLTLFREFGALLRRPGVSVEQVRATPEWSDPSHVVQRVHPPAVLSVPPAPSVASRTFAEAWIEAGGALSERVRDAVVGPPVTGPAVAATVAAALEAEDLLVLGSSNAPRDLALVLGGEETRPRRPGGPIGGARVIASRGLAGIDGTVSTAVGAALAARARRCVALLGDLTFLHDTNGLLIGPDEPRPDLTLVVVNDDGGGIFSTLEYGEPERLADAGTASVTERVFGTPHGTDLAALCAAHDVPHRTAPSLGRLAALLEEETAGAGLRVIEVPVDRSGHRALRDRLRGR